MSNQNKKTYKPKPTEHITVGEKDLIRRQNLLANIRAGIGKYTKSGSNIIYTVGSDRFGYIEYTILNSNLPDEIQTNQKDHGK